MADEPRCTIHTPKPVRDLELEAIALYRAKYPDGIPWQELQWETRGVWVGYAESLRSAGEPQHTKGTDE